MRNARICCRQLIVEADAAFRHLPTGRKESLLLEPRCLLVLSDQARFDWEHGIAARKRDVWRGMRVERGQRVSVTFRFRDKGSRESVAGRAERGSSDR